MIAAVGNDGTRPVVWGIGRTEASARRDALAQFGFTEADAEGIVYHPITADERKRIQSGEVAWPLPRRRSGMRVAPRGVRVDYRPSPEALQALDTIAVREGCSRNAALDRLVLAAAGTK